MDNRYGVLTALLAARLGRVAESTLRQAAAEAVPPGDVPWPDFLIDIGAIRPDEAAALEALAIDLLQVCSGDLQRAASVLQGVAPCWKCSRGRRPPRPRMIPPAPG